MSDIYIATEDQQQFLGQFLDTYEHIAKGGIDRVSAQATELLGAADSCEILDQRTLEAAVDVLKDLKRLEKDFEVARKGAVDPLNQVVKKINSAAKEVYDDRGKTGKLNDAEARLKEKVAVYLWAHPEAKADGVHTAKRFGYTLLDADKLKIDYLTPNAKAIQAVVTAMGKLAEKAVSRLKTKRAIEVEEIQDVRVRTE